MSVFISYKHLDRDLAMQIDRRLKLDNITTYLDVLDAESQSTVDITTVITKNIAKCTHLIAVVSKETATSWWVLLKSVRQQYQLNGLLLIVLALAHYRNI